MYRLASLSMAIVLGFAVTTHGQAVIQEDTLVLMNFDGSIQPEFAKGSGTISLGGGQLVPRGGRFGDGLQLMGRDTLELVGNDGNLNPSEGTIEFWLKPTWAGSDEEKHGVLSARVAEKEYLNINSLGKGRLGIAMASGTGDGFRWRRADGDASDWQPNTWHHVAFAWGDGILSVFLDGEEDAKGVSDSLMLTAAPERLLFAGIDGILDDLHIHNRRFEAADVAKAIEAALNPPEKMLDSMACEASEDVERGGMTILGDVVLPLALGDVSCARGLAMGDGGEVRFDHDGSQAWFCATVGTSAFAAEGTESSFGIWGDGKQLFVSEACHRDDEPLKLRVDLSGRRQIQLKMAGKEMRHQEAVWMFPRLVTSQKVQPTRGGQQLTEKKLDMYRRQLASDDYHCNIDSQAPWIVSAKHWADDVDVTQAPKPLSADSTLEVAAAPGEYEPVNFMIYAIDVSLDDVGIAVSDLKSETGSFPADACNVRLVLRRLMRDLYTLPPDRSTVVSRFLLPNQPVSIPAGTFREYHVIVCVPQDQAPGTYRGTVTITPAAGEKQTIPLAVNVRPIELGPPTPNIYGMYYRFPSDEAEWPGLEREFADIYNYGGRMLKSNLGVAYTLADNGTVVADTGVVHRGLELLAKHGYEGPMPISTGAGTLARLLKYDPVADQQDESARKTFQAAMTQGMKALEQVNADFPQFEIMPTHMDEVFGHDRLPRYIRFTEAVRNATDMRVYITLHNDPKRGVEPLLKQIDPYADVRCFNGHVMDSWIQAGNTFEDLAREMEASGDEAWLYHNIRGSFFPAEWVRLVNGFYMWISPIKVHVPWMYYSYKMNPMDCTDGPELRGGDFAYAVPDPDNPNAMVPTRHWEAYREGVDDMRYLRTLERLIEQHKGTPQADRAARWLGRLRQRVTPSHEDLQKIETESPLLVYLAAQFDGADYQQFREEAGALIAELQK